jgi:Protein of unknown function (DUF4446)
LPSRCLLGWRDAPRIAPGRSPTRARDVVVGVGWSGRAASIGSGRETALDLLDAVVLLLAIVAAVMAALALVIAVRGGGDPFGGAKRAGLERRVSHLAQRMEAVEASADARPRRTAAAAAGGPDPEVTIGGSLSHVGLVRFDAFADAGGAQSFALALLDTSADGVVLTSLHSRQVTRLYVKSIRSGRSDLPLSGEERAALQEAGIRT